MQRLDRADPALARTLPPWLLGGLVDHAGRGRPRDSGIAWERPSLRFKAVYVAARIHQTVRVRDLFTRPETELIATHPRLAAEAEVIAHFLTRESPDDGVEARFLCRYLASLAATCAATPWRTETKCLLVPYHMIGARDME